MGESSAAADDSPINGAHTCKGLAVAVTLDLYLVEAFVWRTFSQARDMWYGTHNVNPA